MAINLNSLISTPAAVFELHGECLTTNCHEGTLCRIRVGPRRWLTEYVFPERLGVTLWLENHGQITYLRQEPVQPSVDENGALTVDMAAFAQTYFGREHIHFCDSRDWKWNRHGAQSGTFLSTDRGLAACRSAWLDISVHHSNLFLLPGTLRLCGHDVRQIYWETFCDDLSASGASVRPLTEALLGAAHTASPQEILRRLEQIELLREWGFNRLTIRTDRGRFSIGTGLDRFLSVDLNEGGQIVSRYEPNRKNSILQDTEILLQLLQASDKDELCTKAEDLFRQGLLIQRKRK